MKPQICGYRFPGRHIRPYLSACALFLLSLGATPIVRAQVESAKVVGSVLDSSGGVVVGAKVTFTNVQTRISSGATTNGAGEYVIAELKPGAYSARFEQTGFKTSEQTGITLDVNQVERIDVTLVPGAVTEKVEVSAAAPLVESQTSSIGQVIEENRVHDLPLNGRDFIQLAYLSPGVNQGPEGTVQQGGIPENERGNGSVQVNGLMATNNNFLLNGFDNNEQQIGFEVIQPSIDAIQEFKVQTSNFGADIGKGGAVVNVVLKSGTNQFHGDIFEFLRNSAMDAKNYFDDPVAKIPPFKQNQFGGTLGGPIIRDKTFFFVDYQGTRIRQSQTDISTVPLLSERDGDFSDQLGAGPTGQIFDPLTTNPNTGVRQPFPGNIIPSCVGTTGRSASGGSCLDPAALNVVKLFPAPNIAGAGASNNFLFNPVLDNNQDSFDVRVDHQVSSRNSFFATFSHGNVDAIQPDPFPGLAGGGIFSGNISNKSLAAGISDIQIISSNMANEFKIGYMRYVVGATPFFTGQPIAQKLGIPGINDPNNPGTTGGLPNIMISGFSNLGNQDYFPESLRENNYQLLDSITYTHGRHSFKTGIDLRRRQHGFFQTQNPRGDLFFDGQFTEDLNNTSANPGSPLASFLIGNPISAFRDGQKGTFGMSWWEISAYFMDDFRVSPKLTLNLGLRYDIFTPEVEDHNRLANFDFSTGQFVRAGMSGVSRSGNVVTNLHNFAPRIGFAYTPFDDNKTVLRGGYGIFYDLQANQNDAELAFNPTGLFGSQSIQFSASSIPAMRLSTGFPTALPFPSLSDPSGRASAAFFNNPTTYIEEWNLNVERQLAKDTVLQVAYVGTHGVDLTFLRNLNQPIQPLDSNFEVCPVPTDPSCLSGLPSNFGRPYFNTVPNIAAIRTEGHDLSSITHGLQVRFEKRFSANWSMLNSYTYQHTIGQSAEDETVGTALEPQNTHNLKAERGNTEPDYRHQFTSAWSYELPFGPGQRFFAGNGVTRWLTGGWQLNGIIALYSGRAFTPYLSSDPTNTGSNGPRPDIVGNPYNFSNAMTVGYNGAAVTPATGGCPSNQQSLQCWFNPAAFAQPAVAPAQVTATLFGNASRGILRGPAQYNVDFSIFKDFKFSESKALQLRGEIFNLFNTPQFGDPNFFVDTPGAGSISNTVNNSRQIQVALKFQF